ncbi:MAG TPA: branched-chain amino acid transaminase [Candidatus Dormibacteraeota bacterium]|nr:branched-chain amino acid transaminase [Candidatus Dormibacteraeota bacterium]
MQIDLAQLTVYRDGTFLPYQDAKVGLLTHGLQYGTGCFEGIRGFWVPEDRELYLLLLREHYGRLFNSAKILLMELPHSIDELIEITVELCKRNHFESDVYIRPCIFKSAEDIGVRLHGVPASFAMIALPFAKYLDTTTGLKACVSSWRRIDDTMAPPRGKITGLYVNSALAKSEAIFNGYDEAIMLSHDGHVAEGSAENIFIVRGEELSTPDPSQNVLEGCTRRAVMQIAADFIGVKTIERSIDRGELYAADEVFFSGSAAGLVHVASIDGRSVGDGTMGPIAKQIFEVYERAVRGKEARYRSWLTPTYRPPLPTK